MGELDDLPSWAGRRTEEVQLPSDQPDQTPATDDAAAPEPPTPPTQPDQPEPSEQSEQSEPDRTTDDGPEIAAATAGAQAPETSPTAPETVPDTAQETAPETASVEAATPSALAETAAPATAPVVQEPIPTRRRSRLRPLLFGLLGLAILAGAAAIGYALASNDSDGTEASGAGTDDAEDPAAPETGTDDQSAAGQDSTDEGDGAEDDAASGSDGDTTTNAAAADEADTDDGTETVTVEVDDEDADSGQDSATDAPLNDGGREAVFRDGKVYLTGAVPSEEVAQTIVAKAEAVVGPGNVINEYEIDPSSTIQPGDSAPLYVEDVVLFDFNSVEIAPPFLPILDLGTLLLSQNPQASVTVVTRTDAVGSEENNLEVARRRAQAVIDYWVSQGVDPDQIVADPRGEEGTSEEDDAETAARQRRAEFIITGLLD